MRQDIRLFFGDREVEFGSSSQVLYNYTETDLHNPSNIKNSYSKNIVIEGTQVNNDIFGHFWNLERYQDYGGSVGVGFNPLTKTDFTLYVGGTLYEKGYAKLTAVERSADGAYSYQVTLYGMIGSFFSHLTYRADDDSDEKLTLADLDYDFIEGGMENAIREWAINKDEVWNAWGTICNYGDTGSMRYNLINYVPAYTGLPSDFSADRALINNYTQFRYFQTSGSSGGVAYKPILNGAQNPFGWSLGDMGQELTEWETLDLRSYLQTPAVRMKYIIEACGNPAINGGYELDLDPHWFNNNNPYYENAWVTLKSISTLGVAQDSGATITGATLQRQTGSRSGDLFNINYTSSIIGRPTNAKVRLRVGFTPSDSTTATTLYTDTDYRYDINQYQEQKYISAGGCIVQLWAMDAANNIVGSSNAVLLSSSKNKANTNKALWWNYVNSDELDISAPSVWVDGVWKKKSGSFVFCNRDGDTTDIDFDLSINAPYDHLVMKIKWPYSFYLQNASENGTTYRWYYYPQNDSMDNYYEVNATGFPMYKAETVVANTNRTISNIIAYNRVRGSFNYSITSFEVTEESYGNFISNSKLSKSVVLGGTSTPCDYLVSFIKAFGLYAYCDPSEQSSDPSTYPAGVVHICDRNTFYTEEIVNIEDRIDYGKTCTITPTIANSKWLSFNVEQVESQVNNNYKQDHNSDYGRQLVNTSYNYDLSTTELYDGNVFKGGIMTREFSKYYKTISEISPYVGRDYDIFPYYALKDNGFSVKLFSSTYEEFDAQNWLTGSEGTISYINNLGLKNGDCIPKVQFHTEDNGSSDGTNVLLFLNGSFNTNGANGAVNYYITDDVPDMYELNDETPCWILTLDEFDAAGSRIARKINALPNFTRDWIIGPQQEGNVVCSWNFGHPQETFVPNVYNTDGDSIYDKCWKDYIKDLYDVNTKKFTAYVKFDEMNVDMLRKYYWFRNGLWRLNKVNDYNINSYDTTQCEFIKVQDTDNYKLDPIVAGGSYRLTLDSYTIGYQGGTISGNVYLQSGGNWRRGDSVKIAYSNGSTSMVSSSSYVSPATGSGQNSNITITIPANASAYTKYITVYVNYEDYPPMEATITQGTDNTPYLNISPTAQTVNATGGEVDYTLTYGNINISSIAVTANVDWIIDTGITGNTVSILVGGMSGDNTRSGNITVSAQGLNGTTLTATATITQTGQAISVSPSTMKFDYWENEETTKTITITTDTDWIASINDD